MSPSSVLSPQSSVLTANIIGLMSGTSVDAMDVALCHFEENITQDGTEPSFIELEVLHYAEKPFAAELKAQIFLAFQGEAGPAELCELNFGLGEAFAAAANSALAEAGYQAEDFDLIASHGQTIYHQVAAGHRPSTLQMADGAIIAARTGLTVAHDFRPADMAVGGQGAPLVPYFDALFFADSQKSRALLNIGGIGNFTYLPAGGNPEKIFALDTGPGNSLMDFAIRHFSQGQAQFDQDGAMAERGAIANGWLNELLSHPYFAAPLPKSTGRELFGDDFARTAIARAVSLGLSPEDILATLTAFTARSVALGVRQYAGRLQQLVVSGGGARNPVLMDMLAEWLPGVEVLQHDQFGVRAEAKEAVAFALLGYELLRNRPANLPHCTGAARPAILGKLAPGDNYARLLQKFAPHMTAFNGQASIQKIQNRDPNSNEELASWPKMPRLSLKAR